MAGRPSVQGKFKYAAGAYDGAAATASLNFTGRSLASIFGPAASTALWNALSASAPFLASSVLKISYDLSLYALFRKVKPPEEAARRRSR